MQTACESTRGSLAHVPANRVGAQVTQFRLAEKLNRVSIVAVKLLSVTQLKAEAGKILDRALNGQPQYVVRDGGVVQISKAALIAGVEDRPPGYFNDDYAHAPDERLALERAMGKARQR